MKITKGMYHIAEMLCEGYSEVEIASQLGFTPARIRSYINKWQRDNNMNIIPLIAAFTREKMRNYYENREEYSSLYKVSLTEGEDFYDEEK